MKRSVFLSAVVLLLISCTEKVSIDLEEGPKRFVVEATAIQIHDADNGILNVKLIQTADYFSSQIPKITGAEIKLKVGGQVYPINPIEGRPGFYKNSIPMIDTATYRLQISYKNELYSAETQLAKTVPIDTLRQSDGIFSEDEIGVDVFFTDPPTPNDCYLFSYKNDIEDALSTTCDDTFNGNQFSTFYGEEFKTGDTLKVSIQGITPRFSEYLSIILQQSSGGGNPFAPTAATARGNIINETHPEEKPLGYFRVSQQYQKTYVFK